MTKHEAIAYAAKNWNWEKRDCTLAANRWDLMGDEIVRRIEAEAGAEVLPLSVAEEMHYLACQAEASQHVAPLGIMDRVALAAGMAATVAAFAFPYFL